MAGNRFVPWRKRLVALLAAACVLSAMPGTVLAADEDELDTSVSESESRKQELEQKSQELTEALEEAKKNTADQEALHRAYQDKIDVLNQQIEEISGEASQLDQEINDLRSQISNREGSVEKNTALLKERIRAIYMAGETSTLDIILGATDFNDFLDKATLLKLVSDHDTRLIETLQAETSKLGKEKENYERKKAELDAQMADLDIKNVELAQLLEESGLKLSQLQQQQQEVLQSLDNTSAELEQLNSDIEAYYAARRQEYEEQRNQELLEQIQQLESQPQSETPETPSQAPETSSSDPESSQDGENGEGSETEAPSSGEEGGTSSEEESESGESSGSDSGQDSTEPSGGAEVHNYTWPTPGFYWLSSAWNEDRNTYNHGAIDVAGAGIFGTPILAAQSGTVSTSWYNNGGWGGGYGTYCMINHDDWGEYSTLYAHMSQIVVSPGQWVEQGQVIGYVGSTGDSSGPHLHLECRHWGVKYDPMTEFPGVPVYY